MPYRHILVDSEDPLSFGLLAQLAMRNDETILRNDLDTHDSGTVNFFHLSCTDFQQTGVSKVIVPRSVEVEKTVITNPNHDLSPPLETAKIGRRFVCLIDSDFRDEIQGIEQFVFEINQHYAENAQNKTEALILFSDESPPPISDSVLPFEMDENDETQELWNNPVWGYVRIFGNSQSSMQPLHDDKDKALVITDFSPRATHEEKGVFAYQNYQVSNLESRLYTGLSHFISQYQSLNQSLVRSSMHFIDPRTENLVPTSILHSIAYDPLILHPREAISNMEASIYCNIGQGKGLWGNKTPKPWNGSDKRRTLWDLASGNYENIHITRLCKAFVTFLREPTQDTASALSSSLEAFTESVLSEAEMYGVYQSVSQLSNKINEIVENQFPNSRVPDYHIINQKYTNNLVGLTDFFREKFTDLKGELENKLRNPTLVSIYLKASAGDYLHDMIHLLFTDSDESRLISTYNLFGGSRNG